MRILAISCRPQATASWSGVEYLKHNIEKLKRNDPSIQLKSAKDLSVSMRENICRFSSFSQIDYNMAGGQWIGSITVSRKVPLLWNLSCLHLALCRFLHFGQWRFLHLFAGSEGQDLKSQRCRHMLWSLSLRPVLVCLLSVWPQLCWCFAKYNSTTTVLEGFTLKHWANIMALFWNKKNPRNVLIY